MQGLSHQHKYQLAVWWRSSVPRNPACTHTGSPAPPFVWATTDRWGSFVCDNRKGDLGPLHFQVLKMKDTGLLLGNLSRHFSLTVSRLFFHECDRIAATAFLGMGNRWSCGQSDKVLFNAWTNEKTRKASCLRPGPCVLKHLGLAVRAPSVHC